MAKTAGVNKSKAIREYLTTKPGAGPREVCESLAAKGIEVSQQLVSQVKARMGAKKKRKKRVVKKPQQASPAGVSPSSQGLRLADLVETKKLVDQLGGAKQVRAALDALERLR